MFRFNQKFLVFLLILFFVSPVMSEQFDENDVRESVQKFGDAFSKGDVSILSNLLCESYVHVNGISGNVLNKKEWLNWIASRRLLLDNGNLVIHIYTVEDIQVIIYGESAVVTGIVKSEGHRNGVSFKKNIRFTNLWVFDNDALRRASFHDSVIPNIK